MPALRLRPQAAGGALPLARVAPRGCSSASPRSTASCAREERAWSVRHGRPETEVRRVAREAGAATVHVSDDVTGFARSRDARVEAALGARRRRPAPPPRPLRGRPAADRDGTGRPLQGLHAVPARLARAGAPGARARAARHRDGARRGGRAAVAARAGLRRAPAAPAGPSAAGRRRRPPRRRALAAQRRPRALRRAPRRPGRADLAPVGPPALRLPVAAVARAAGGRAAAAALPRPTRVARLPRRRAAALPRDGPRRVRRALPRPGVGSRPRTRAGLARGRAPASRSSTRRCASSPPPGGCTTARG